MDARCFRLFSPTVRLEATDLEPIVSLNDHDGELVVGAIPFSPQETPVLYRAHTVNWDADPLPARPSDTTITATSERSDYRSSVRRAVNRIRAGHVDKVVLGRMQTMTCNQELDPDVVFARLAQTNPTAYAYQLPLPRGASLVGASPELVLEVDAQGQARSFPLAGSVPKTGDAATDRHSADSLLRDDKCLREHRFVTDAIGAVFADFCEDVTVPASPEIVGTPVLWHLGTPITGRLSSHAQVPALLADLHPTPAVCGWPVGAARELIAEEEPEPRGVFAGLIGWMKPTGECGWAMTLRGGIISGRTAKAYAGAGIVAESDPDSEFVETTTKLLTFTHAL